MDWYTVILLYPSSTAGDHGTGYVDYVRTASPVEAAEVVKRRLVRSMRGNPPPGGDGSRAENIVTLGVIRGLHELEPLEYWNKQLW